MLHFTALLNQGTTLGVCTVYIYISARTPPTTCSLIVSFVLCSCHFFYECDCRFGPVSHAGGLCHAGGRLHLSQEHQGEYKEP